MKITRKHILWVALASLLIPFPSTVVPEWKITVVDKLNEPVTAVTVEQHWRHYTLESSDNLEEKITDGNGQIVFKKRVIWSNILIRFFGGLNNILSTGVHASFGPSAGIFARKGCEIGFLTYIPSKKLKDTLILNGRMRTKECS